MKKVVCPLDVWLPGKKPKKIILNLNWYIWAHYREQASAKLEYKKLLKLPEEIKYPVEVEFLYYAKTGRDIDISNPVSVIDKFVCDVLVQEKLIPSDSFRVIKRHHGWQYMGVDKENPRCEMIIYEPEDCACNSLGIV